MQYVPVFNCDPVTAELGLLAYTMKRAVSFPRGVTHVVSRFKLLTNTREFHSVMNQWFKMIFMFVLSKLNPIHQQIHCLFSVLILACLKTNQLFLTDLMEK